MVTLNPYLNFMGRAKEAMEFYASVFGGKLTIQTYQEGGMNQKPEEASLVMHAMLVTPDIMFMAADGNADHPVTAGNSVNMSLSGEDSEKLTAFFQGLSDHATIEQPLMKAPWGDTFGMLTDKFGIHWLVNISAPKK